MSAVEERDRVPTSPAGPAVVAGAPPPVAAPRPGGSAPAPGGAPGAAPRTRRRLSFGQRVRRDGLRWARHVACLVPFLLIIWDGAHNRLTVNPVQEITDRTGKTALVILLLSLAVTPADRLLGWRWLIPLRRPLGLYAFFYATLHFLTFAVVDYGLDWSQIQAAIVEKRYVLAGFAAFLCLLPLAVTSTKGWMRRLGKRWRSLHRLVYVAAALVILHFVWLVKADRTEPLRYGAVLAALLLLRTPLLRGPVRAVRRWVRDVSGLASPAPRRTAAAPETSETPGPQASSRPRESG